MMLSSDLKRRALVVVMVLVLLWVGECKPQKGRKRRGHNTTAMLARHRMDLYWRLLKYVFCAVVAPAIVGFVYSLLRDPAVPQLLREVSALLKRRFTKTLSSTDQQSSPRKTTNNKS